ncbi:MAG: HigA family addiction module antitoxin [Planctomycetota bacterium]
MPRKPKKMPPVHPGEVLKTEFLDELEISAYRLALDTGMPASRIGRIVAGERSVSADTALRLAKYFGTTPEFWLDLQSYYDLESTRDAVGREIERNVKARAAG